MSVHTTMARVEGRVLQPPAIQYRGDQRVSFMSIHTVMYTHNCACKCDCPYIASQLFGLVNFAELLCCIDAVYNILVKETLTPFTVLRTFLQCKN